jgi:hypothetical protein
VPARKQPTREDAVTARKILLDGPAGDAGIFDLISELAPLHPRDLPPRSVPAGRRRRAGLVRGEPG